MNDESKAEDLDPMEDLLRMDAGTYREVLRESQAPQDAESEEAVAQLRRAILPRRNWIKITAWVAAAAVALLAVFFLLSEKEQPQRPSGWLNSDREAWPEGEVAAWGIVRWKLPLADGQEYRFELRDADAASGTAPLVRVDGMLESEWKPPDGFEWPQRVHWRVLVLEGGLPTGASIDAEARLKD